MTSRLVTVDLILSLSLQLRQWEQLSIAEEGSLDFYTSIRQVLNDWATQIEEQGLAVQLETIAESAVQIYRNSNGEGSMERLITIGDKLIERAREIEAMILIRSVELLHLPIQKEIAKALKEGESVKFRKAADDITVLKNPTDAKDRLKEFLTLAA